jgi:hypothetical protein
MTEDLFSDRDSWLGGYYELTMVYDRPEEKTVRASVQAIWQHEDLSGPVASRDRPFAEQPRADLRALLPGHGGYGCARLPGGSIAPCGVNVVDPIADPTTYVGFFVPFGVLDHFYPGIWSDEPWEPWARPLEDWFASVGEQVYRAAPFRVALIGEEPGGLEDTDWVMERIGHLRPGPTGGLAYRPARWD